MAKKQSSANRPAKPLKPEFDEHGFLLETDPEFNFEQDIQSLTPTELRLKVQACVDKHGEYGIHRISDNYVGRMREHLS